MSIAPCVVVAHDNETIRRVIEALLKAAGFAVQAVEDGAACVRVLEDGHNAALVLDVAIGGVLAFEVVEVARRRVPRVPVVLVASIYNRTSYKRRPTSLYGADDYVEQHHIADSLVNKLIALVGAPLPAVAFTGAASGFDDGHVVRAAAEGALAGGGADVGPEAVERAQRLARLIVSDIALYNADAVASARGGGSSDELEARLRLDLEEGRLLFELRVPQAVRRERDFIAEALRDLIIAPVEEKVR